MSDLGRAATINRYRALREFARGEAEVEAMPRELQIARTNLCNFKCVYCPEQRDGNTAPRVRLDGDEWEDLVKLIPSSEILAFHGVSEFMMDPQFFEIIERCGQAGVELSINTNGSVATDKHVNALVNYPGRIGFNISIDAATPYTYARVRGWDFTRLLGNIETLVRAFAARRTSTWLSFSFVIMRSTLREMVPFLFLARAFGIDSVSFYRLHEDGSDWVIPAGLGEEFDYAAECVSRLPEEYNAELERTRAVAANLDGLMIHLPAPFDEVDLAALAAERDRLPARRRWWHRLFFVPDAEIQA